MPRFPMPSMRTIPLLAALLVLAGCTTSRWQFVRQRPDGKAETTVKVISEPPGAEVTLNGNYMGTTPFEVPIRYPFELRHYERRNALPYPHVEEKEVKTYKKNVFTFHFHLMGHEDVVKEVPLNGEETTTVEAALPPR